MKKVINITLGSIVFAIEQDAYDMLSSYLERIKANLTNTDDATEVVDDIESAIAEKFIARKRSEKLAITVADVEQVMSEMGSPADFGEGETVGTSTDEVNISSAQGSDPKRRLYRDTDNTIIAGVAAGLARFFDIDPVIVRVLFVVSVFFNGLGILAYIILWLVVPPAKTTADKYAMRGERVTLKDISERVKKNIQGTDETNIETAKSAWSKIRGVLNTLFSVLGAIVRCFVVVARYVVGIVLVIAGALGLAGMVSVYSVILLSDKVFFPTDVQVALETLQGSTLGIIAMISSFIVMAIPLNALVMTGASLIAKRNFFTVQKTVTFVVIWIVAAVVAGTTSVLQVEQVMQRLGPIEGRFDDSSFKVEWKNGSIFGNHGEVRFSHKGYEDTLATYATDPKNATYFIDGKTVQLTNGYSESETPGSGSKIITRYFGNELVTDLDGDGDNDVAFILTQETGGTGTFYYAVAALSTEDGYVGSDGYLLGDRIAPQMTNVSPNPRHKYVVVFNYVDRAQDEPMGAQPSVGKSVFLKLVPESMQWAIVEPDFEGESAL